MKLGEAWHRGVTKINISAITRYIYRCCEPGVNHGNASGGGGGGVSHVILC